MRQEICIFNWRINTKAVFATFDGSAPSAKMRHFLQKQVFCLPKISKF
jgi:hypothetical protein